MKYVSAVIVMSLVMAMSFVCGCRTMAPNEKVYIDISREGTVILDGKKIPAATLVNKVKSMGATPLTPFVIKAESEFLKLDAEGKLTHPLMKSITSDLASNGYKRLSISGRLKKSAFRTKKQEPARKYQRKK